MNLNDILGWISRNGLAAFLIGCFLTAMATIITNFLVRLVRSVTGNYPPVAELCDADDPCYCCRENLCDEGCRCHANEDDGEEEGEDEDDA